MRVFETDERRYGHFIRLCKSVHEGISGERDHSSWHLGIFALHLTGGPLFKAKKLRNNAAVI